MPTYKITDPNTGQTVKLTGDSPPSGAELEQIFAGLERPATQQVQQAQEIPQETPITDYGTAAVSGANVLAPALAGMPVDFARNLANLGIAGYGVARKEIGEALGEEGYIPPELLPPQPGGSEWMQEKMAAGTQAVGGGDPFAIPDPTDPTQQKLHMAGTILASGALAPSTGIKQTAANIAKMTIPAGGAIGMKEAFPAEPLAPLVGMMAAPAAVAAIGKAKTAIIPKVDATKAFLKAHKLGYKVPPALAKPTKTQQMVEGGIAGSAVTRQKASIHNQQVTNELIKKDIGYPKEVPFSRDGLASIRSEAGKIYEQAKGVGTFKTDASFMKDINKIANQGSALAKEFPGMVKQDVVNLAKTFNKKQISSEALVEAVKQLRADSSAGFRSQDPATLALAKANGKMANALEGLMERSIKVSQPDLLPALKAARQKIAKTYQIEKVLKGENVDAVTMGRELNKGKPMSGAMKDVAEFGQNFKGAAMTDVPQPTGYRITDTLLGIGGAAATQNPMYLALAGARPAVRSVILSKPYQAMLARPNGGAIRNAVIKAMKLPERESIAALNAIMAEESQRSGNAASR